MVGEEWREGCGGELTLYGEKEPRDERRMRGDLTFVVALVPLVGVADEQLPVVGLAERRFVAAVADVHLLVVGEQLHAAVAGPSQPRHLSPVTNVHF